MKISYVVIEDFPDKNVEIRDILKILGLDLIKSYNWVLFDMNPIASWDVMDEVKRVESSVDKINPLSGDYFIGLMNKTQTDWGVCFAFKKGITPSFDSEPISDPIERYMFQNELADIEIRSFDGSRLFVFAKDETLIKKLGTLYKSVVKQS